MSVLIKGGRVVTASDDYVGDVFIENERPGPCSKPWSTGSTTRRPVPPTRPCRSRRERFVSVPAEVDFSLPCQV